MEDYDNDISETIKLFGKDKKILSDALEKFKKTNLKTVAEELKLVLPKITECYEFTHRVRKGFHCILCSPATHSAANFGGNTLTYSVDFCKTLTGSFLPAYKTLYESVLTYLMDTDFVSKLLVDKTIFKPEDVVEIMETIKSIH